MQPLYHVASLQRVVEQIIAFLRAVKMLDSYLFTMVSCKARDQCVQ